jgi:hypothetical protein
MSLHEVMRRDARAIGRAEPRRQLPLRLMTPRLRIVAFGAAAVFVVAGALCAAFVAGVTGEVLTVVLMSIGFAGALLLVFLEIGLGEERDLARDEERRRRRTMRAIDARRRGRLPQRPRRPS